MRMRGACVAVCAAATITLAGCTGPVEVVSANSQVVTLRHSADAGYKAEHYAQDYCRQYNKVAHWRSSTPEPTNQEFTIYDCVPM